MTEELLLVRDRLRYSSRVHASSHEPYQLMSITIDNYMQKMYHICIILEGLWQAPSPLHSPPRF